MFYKLYKSFEKWSFPVFWSDVKAASTISILLFFTIFSFFIYYQVFIDRYTHLSDSNFEIYIFFAITAIMNYFLFYKNKKWKKIIKEFDQLPQKTNRIGSVLVILFLILVMGNFGFTIYMLSQIDWSLYR